MPGKYRINTTISRHHGDLLRKYAQTYGTQQKVLESALENISVSPDGNAPLSRQHRLWMQYADVDSACLVQKACLRLLMETADLEAFRREIEKTHPIEYAIEYCLHKPLAECSLEEVIDGLVLTARMSHWYDSVTRSDNGGYFTLVIAHSLGRNLSEMLRLLNDSVFATCGVRFESTVSEKTLIMKIFKKTD